MVGFFIKLNSIPICFYKTTELNVSSYVKNPKGSSVILYIENNDKYCFIWSLCAHLLPCDISHCNRVSNYTQ